MKADCRFPREARVRAKADFDRIFKHGRRVALPVLALHWLDETAPTTGSGGDAAGASVRHGAADRPRAFGSHTAPAATGAVLPTPSAAGPGPTPAQALATSRASAGEAVSSRPPATVPRMGLAVSRKVDPRAVGRNRIKRALRETFRAHRGRLAPAAYVVVARPGARGLSGEQLSAALLALLRRAGALERALPLPAPAGTMPPAACASPDAPPSG